MSFHTLALATRRGYRGNKVFPPSASPDSEITMTSWPERSLAAAWVGSLPKPSLSARLYLGLAGKRPWFEVGTSQKPREW